MYSLTSILTVRHTCNKLQSLLFYHFNVHGVRVLFPFFTFGKFQNEV